MSDLSFVAGEVPRLASTAREAAEAVRSARPEGGASAFASAMPGTSLSSQMHGVEDKFADQATKTGTSLDEHADSFLFPHRAMVVSRLITVRVFLVTQTSRRGITGTVGIAAATNPALARVGRRLSPCPMTQSGRSSPWIRSSQGRPVPAPFRNLPSSFPRCLP